MSETSISTSHAITAEQFNDMAFREYTDKLVLKQYMGTDSEAMIHVNENLSKAPGDAITFNLASQIDGAGVEGESDMEGNEEALVFYGQRVTLQLYKNAVRLGGDLTEQRSPFDIKMEAKPNLTTWLAHKVEDKMFEALASFDGVAYSSATETQKDAFLASNSDRFLFGATTANNAGNDHSTCLSEIDGTTDILKTETISLAKRLAQLADPKIRPIKLMNGEEWYVMFVHPLAARDLKNTDAWKNAQQYARLRGDGNNIFTGALGEWDGVVLVESNKCPLLPDVGNGATVDVAANFLCGSQALLYAQGGFGSKGRVSLTEKLFDYDSKWGCQIKTMFGHAKAVFNSKQHGVVTVYTSAQPD
jgi:N4-gp56 family major capsid protein